MSIEAMKQALEALESERDKYLEWGDTDGAPEDVYEAITALRTAIAEAEKQKPVGWICEGSSSDEKHTIDYWQEDVDAIPIGTMLYTTPPAPPKREWVGLTDEEVHDAFNFVEFVKQVSFDRDRPEWCENFAAYLEAKLKEKNE